MLYFVGREWRSSEISFGKWAKRISKTILMILAKRPLSHGGDVESQENKKLCFCAASLTLNLLLAEACCAKTKLFISPRLNMAAE